jgi:hypothetical protein
MVLMKYGFDKLFKTQFYLPEPNTLYTPLGMIDRDLLYWSAIGTSKAYNIFLGLTELTASILLMVKRTRIAGLLLSAAILCQVVAVNFAFDISVKLFSVFLLTMSLFLLVPHFKRLYRALFSPGAIAATTDLESNAKLRFARTIKLFVIALMLGEALGPYLESRNFNDDLSERPPLHGAYEVRHMISGNDTLSGKLLPVRRFFFHRNGYLVWQDAQDRMQDFAITYDLLRSRLRLADYSSNETLMSYEMRSADSTLTLRKISGGSYLELTGKQLDWRSLPLLRESFHWTIEE